MQSRIEELEAQLSESKHDAKKTHSKTESEKLRENTIDDAADEANRLLHAMAHAFVEQLRAAADVVNSVADEAFKRSDAQLAKSDKTLRTRLEDIEDDVAGVVNKGIEKSLAAPRRVVDKFHQVYHERAKN
jgi:ABC-type transporter Mla subunit MlaD